MPTAMDLPQLLQQSIGSPACSAVDFKHLQKLLYEIIARLDNVESQAGITHGSASSIAPQPPSDQKKNIPGLTKSTTYHHLQDKVNRLERELGDLHTLPSTSEMLEKVKQEKPLTELWQHMQISKKADNNSEGVAMAMNLIEELAKDVKGLKDENGRLKDQLSKLDIDNLNKQLQQIEKMKEELTKMAGFKDKLKDLDAYKRDLDSLVTRLEGMPAAEELVTWAGMEDALNGVKGEMAAYRTESRQRLEMENRSTAMTPQPPTAQPPTPQPAPVSSSARPMSGRHSEMGRSSRARSVLSDGPSNDMLDVMEHLGSVNKRHSDLKKRVDDLERDMANKANKEDVATNIPDDLVAKLQEMQDKLGELDDLRSKDAESIKRAQKAVMDLQAELEKMRQLGDYLSAENEQRTKETGKLKASVEKLNKTKADKDYVDTELDLKADKRSVDSKVNRSHFDSTITDLQNMIDDLLSKLLAYEDAWKKAHSKLDEEVDGKIDRGELERLKAWVDRKLKEINKKLKGSQGMFDPFCEDAAGLKRQLLPFNCLSCDKPVTVSTARLGVYGLSPQPAANQGDGFSANKSTRPYTTYELDQIRQHAKSLLNADYVMDYYSMPRQCGGSHTMTYPHKRTTKAGTKDVFADPGEIPPEILITVRDETDIVGADGHVYRGRAGEQLEAKLPPQLQDQSPSRPRTSPGKRTTSARAPAARPKTAHGQSSHSSPEPGRARPVSARERPGSTMDRPDISMERPGTAMGTEVSESVDAVAQPLNINIETIDNQIDQSNTQPPSQTAV